MSVHLLLQVHTRSETRHYIASITSVAEALDFFRPAPVPDGFTLLDEEHIPNFHNDIMAASLSLMLMPGGQCFRFLDAGKVIGLDDGVIAFEKMDILYNEDQEPIGASATVREDILRLSSELAALFNAIALADDAHDRKRKAIDVLEGDAKRARFHSDETVKALEVLTAPLSEQENAATALLDSHFAL